MATVTVAPPLTVDRSATGTKSHMPVLECAALRFPPLPLTRRTHPHPPLRALLVALSRSRQELLRALVGEQPKVSHLARARALRRGVNPIGMRHALARRSGSRVLAVV